MALIARIIGVSLITAGLGAGLGFAFFGRNPDSSGISLLLACVGAIIGAVAGAAREIVPQHGNAEKVAGRMNKVRGIGLLLLGMAGIYLLMLIIKFASTS